MPDLDVQDAGQYYPPTLSASSVIAGDNVTFTYRLSNWGSDAAPNSFTGFYWSTDSTISVADHYIGYNWSASLLGGYGVSETFTFSTSGWAAGNYYIGGVADYINLIAETNESNNASSGVWLTVKAVNNPPVISIIAGLNYAAGTVLTGDQLVSVSDPQGSADIDRVVFYDATTSNGAVWKYDGSVVVPGGGAAGFSVSYANLSHLTYTVGTGTNDFAVEAFDKSGANSVNDPVGISQAAHSAQSIRYARVRVRLPHSRSMVPSMVGSMLSQSVATE